MTITRYIAGGIAAAGLLCSSTAFAGEATRSASTLPSTKLSLKRVHNVDRASKSVQDESHVLVGASLIILLVAGAAVTAGVVAVATTSNG